MTNCPLLQFSSRLSGFGQPMEQVAVGNASLDSRYIGDFMLDTISLRERGSCFVARCVT